MLPQGSTMPGLLQSSEGGLASLNFVAAFFAELIGVLIFTLYGSAVKSEYGPWGNGITLAVLGESSLSLETRVELDVSRNSCASSSAFGAARNWFAHLQCMRRPMYLVAISTQLSH